MTTLRDALSSALDASEAGTLPSVAETPVESVEAPVETAVSHEAETADAKEARLRDEAGRFAKPAETPAAEKPKRVPPSSWHKDYHGDWERIDPRVQEYLDKREQDYAKGVSTYKQQFDQVAPLQRAIQPFMPTLQQRGITPDRWLQDLGYVDRILSSGSMAEKTQLIQRMAAANGVQLGQQQGDPNLQYLLQNVNGLQTELQSLKSLAAQQEQTALLSQVSQFAVDKPHFEAVRSTMGQLLQSGVADSLQTAYDKAIRLHDDLWQEHQASQAKDAEAKRQAEIARKKAAASSPRSASPTGPAAAANGKKSLRETLSEAMDSVGGRV